MGPVCSGPCSANRRSPTPTSLNSVSVSAVGRRFGPPTGQKFPPSHRASAGSSSGPGPMVRSLHDEISRTALLDKAAGAV